jgi:hypothetical protein
MQSVGSRHHRGNNNMKKLILFCSILMSLSVAAQYSYKNLEVNFEPTDANLASFTYKNLRLYPIKARTSFTDTFRHVGKYLTLKEALAAQKLIITEQAGGATVNTLTVENISNDTIMIMSGEVITGGKQNRIIGKDLIVIPHSGKIDISVFCVEAGRWENQSTGTNQFSGYYSMGSNSLRQTVEKASSQAAVWKKVDEINASNGTLNDTKAYTGISNSKEFIAKLKGYTDFFKDKFKNEKNVVGVVIVSGNKVLGCDMFATQDLFTRNFENLLNAYATDAIMHGSEVKVTSSAVRTYMDKLLSNETEQAKTIKEKGNVFVKDGVKLRVSSYE